MNFTDTVKLSFIPEWARHEATWLGWPHLESDYPGKLSAVEWVYVDIIYNISKSERVELLVKNESEEKRVRNMLLTTLPNLDMVRFHTVPYERTWLRDIAPTCVGVQRKDGENTPIWLNWFFNAWGEKYSDFAGDAEISEFVTTRSSISGIIPDWRVVDGEVNLLSTIQDSENSVKDLNNIKRVTLEGGSIEGNGDGVVLTTEACLLSGSNVRNKGRDKRDFERLFEIYLGAKKVVWLEDGYLGDDTSGHIDNIARFVSNTTVVFPFEQDKSSPNFEICRANYKKLKEGLPENYSVIPLPFPKARSYMGDPLPLSYANFYICNDRVLVPTFNTEEDRLAISILKSVFSSPPGGATTREVAIGGTGELVGDGTRELRPSVFQPREIVPIHSLDLLTGLGGIHCMSQQQYR